MRILFLFVIGVFFGTGLGFLLFGDSQAASHDHAGHSNMQHDHSALVAWAENMPLPELSLEVYPDGPSSRNLRIVTKGYRWAPEEVNGDVRDGAGHAHVYINGEKIARVYGEWVHLPNLPQDEPVTIRVTLNANNHAGWKALGHPIFAEVEVR